MMCNEACEHMAWGLGFIVKGLGLNMSINDPMQHLRMPHYALTRVQSRERLEACQRARAQRSLALRRRHELVRVTAGFITQNQ